MAAFMAAMAAHKQTPCGPAPILTSRELTQRRGFVACRASNGSSHEVHGHDLYELLCVDRDASLQDIRRSYRWLQKKCHPDVAGVVGHDMSILLNQAYSTLTDPNKRADYDQSLADFSVLSGYTGCPLYSKWFGPPHEKRAVFVDESRCVGCLKCALIAPNTFAIENRFGRARAVGQWADPQPVIQDAIKACPVDCITWVDRSQLAAFEFVMSKEPRVTVGVKANSNGGRRSSDVFKGVQKLLEKLKKQEERKTSYATETPAQRKARLAAMNEVHAWSGRWWYYFVADPNVVGQMYSNAKREAHGAIVPLSFYKGERNQQISDSGGDHHRGNKQGSEFEGELHRLFEAAKKRRLGQSASPGGGAYDDEYWVPLSRTCGPAVAWTDDDDSTVARNKMGQKQPTNREVLERKLSGWMRQMVSGAPVLTAVLAGWFVGTTGVPGAALSSNEMGVGPVPMDWSHSMELQVLSAALVWYLIGAAVANASVLVTNFIRGQQEEPTSH